MPACYSPGRPALDEWRHKDTSQRSHPVQTPSTAWRGPRALQLWARRRRCPWRGGAAGREGAGRGPSCGQPQNPSFQAELRTPANRHLALGLEASPHVEALLKGATVTAAGLVYTEDSAA